MNGETRTNQTTLDCNSERSHGMIAQDAYIGCALKYGWNMEKKAQFGLRKLLYANDATPEGYAVWFLPHSNLSKTAHSKGVWENRIIGNEIEERWCIPRLEDRRSDRTLRVTFVKRENGKYYFQGVYRLISSTREQDPVTHKLEQIKRYRRVSETYPFDEASLSPTDRLRALRAYIAQHYRPFEPNAPRICSSVISELPRDIGPSDIAKDIETGPRRLSIPPLYPEDDFAKTLLTSLEAKGISNAECYKRANIDRKLFSKIISNEGYTPKKPTAIALILTLHPSKEETSDLLSRLGYCLSHSSMFDLVIEWCVQNRVYETDDVNVLLDSLGLPLLGSY